MQTNSKYAFLFKEEALTYARIFDVFPNAPFEEAGTPVTAVDSVVFPVALVPAHLAGYRHRQRPTWERKSHMTVYSATATIP